MIELASERSRKEQEASYTALLQSLGKATFSEIEEVLAVREVVEPEPGLTPEVLEKLQLRIAEKRASTAHELL